MSKYTREEVLEKIRNRESLAGADLRKINLYREDLSGANLKAADLSGADLREAKFTGTNLDQANLSEANLNEANLWEANLVKADLSGAKLARANLWRAKLAEANLSGAYFLRADLGFADLNEANLEEADLGLANLGGADLRRANLASTNINGTNLWEANLYGATLAGANLRGANLSGANLRSCDLRLADLTQAKMAGADLTGANIWGIGHTGWIVEGLKAGYVYNYKGAKLTEGIKGKTRIPPNRSFNRGEFQEWLSKYLPFKTAALKAVPFEYVPKIFISYASEDELTMRAIDQCLRNKGVRVFIDERNFIGSETVCHEVINLLKGKGVVVFIYSKSAADRSYTEFEKLIDREREFIISKGQEKRNILIYFCIDGTPLPAKLTRRLIIKAATMSFPEACQKLWRAILEQGGGFEPTDLAQYNEITPWKR